MDKNAEHELVITINVMKTEIEVMRKLILNLSQHLLDINGHNNLVNNYCENLNSNIQKMLINLPDEIKNAPFFSFESFDAHTHVETIRDNWIIKN